MIIGLTGCKGVGKDTAAQFLVEERGYHRAAFADKLKEAVANLFGIDRVDVDRLKEEENWNWLVEIVSIRQAASYRQLTWRELLQRFGTEMGRETFGTNFWVDLALPKDDKPLRNTVFTDCRFNNEALRIIGHKGYIMQITRPGHEPDGHASENPISDPLIDSTVVNDSDMDTFRRRFLATYDATIKGVAGSARNHV